MKNLIFFLAVFFAFINANAQTPGSNQSKSSGAKIEFKSILHDFGDIAKGSGAKCEFVFTNTGNEPLVISEVKASCDCTVPSWPKEPIFPGQKGVITVVYDTEKAGVISKEINIISNAVNSSIELRITGFVVE